MNSSGSQRILVPHDGSTAAMAATAMARVLGAQLGAAPTLLHVAAEPILQSEARKELGLDSSEHSDLTLLVRVGDVSAEIALEASGSGASLIVMPTFGQRRRHNHDLAPVTEQTLLSAECPVALVRPELVRDGTLQPVHRLLLPLDGSPTTARIMRSALELAARLGATVDLLYIAGASQGSNEPGGMSAPRYADQSQHEWPSWNQEVVDRLCRCLARCPEDVEINMFMATGEPGPTIATFALDHAEDGIMLVRRSQLQAGRGKILREVLGRTPIPIIFVIPNMHKWVPRPVVPRTERKG